MESLDQQDLGPTQHSHQFQYVQISGSARAHLGDTYNTYNISKLLVEKKVKYYEELTRCRLRKPAQPPTVCNECAIQLVRPPTRTLFFFFEFHSCLAALRAM
jgi:hypothetical protein